MLRILPNGLYTPLSCKKLKTVERKDVGLFGKLIYVIACHIPRNFLALLKRRKQEEIH